MKDYYGWLKEQEILKKKNGKVTSFKREERKKKNKKKDKKKEGK